MSVMFGVIDTAAGGLGAVILQSANTSDTIQTAEAYDQYGNVIALNGYGRKTGGSFGVLLDGEVSIKAGDVLTISNEKKLLTAVNTTRTKNGYAEGSVDYDGAPGVEPQGPINGSSN